jgi:hypothetical protein
MGHAAQATAVTIACAGPAVVAVLFLRKLLQSASQDSQQRRKSDVRSRSAPRLRRRGQQLEYPEDPNDEDHIIFEEDVFDEDLALDLLGWDGMHEWYAEDEVEAMQQLHNNTKAMARMAQR